MTSGPTRLVTAYSNAVDFKVVARILHDVASTLVRWCPRQASKMRVVEQACSLSVVAASSRHSRSLQVHAQHTQLAQVGGLLADRHVTGLEPVDDVRPQPLSTEP